MKKQFIILLVLSIFMIGAVSFISASDIDDDLVGSGADDVVDTSDDVVVQGTSSNSNDKVNLTISMKWNDNNGPNRPSSVTVYVKNGDKQVESVVLSSANGWTKTVDVDKYDSSGKQISYSVSADKISMYKDPVVTKNGNSFVITNELKEVLSASNTNNVVKENNSSNTSNATNDTDSNKTDSNSTGTDNKTINNNTINNKTVNNVTINNKTINNTNVNNTTVNSVLIKKPPAKEVKNDTDKQKKNPLKNTGNPILILVVVIIVIAVAYYFYSKR
ncbi:Cna B-type domain-containing protein [Methanobrevibacter sp.]|uniref:Cna B-type domain-containing protein n=1 Tax=Methanobrevibacter sp. TaxID=66852 RepID=UPI002E78B128|nr:Cna B-type domain-containing protein [Methanobrevibacter sp.]MEE0939278.1 Cna B-type domain-containing protein [Methanobrevibacter sp.]